MKDWIKVEDALPEPGEEVLVNADGMNELTIYHGPQWDEVWDTMYGDDITHWMRIPPIPEDSA